MTSKQKKVAVFVGTGGVGKTTLSSLYSLSLKGERSLITIDPSKRLKDLFKNNKSLDGLTVSLSERKNLFNEFLDEHIEDKELLERFKNNSLFKSLMNNLAVSQEFTSFYELVKLFKNKDVDKIILDTPPLQNSSDFFNGAQLLEKLFSGRLITFFIPDEDRGFISKVFNRSREIALSALSRLTGSEFMRELSEFFEVSQKVRVPLINVLKQAQEIIRESSELFLVASYEELSLIRLGSSIDDLIDKGFKIKTCYINRYYDGSDHLEQRLEKILSDLDIKHSDIIFKKVNMIQEEPNNIDKLIKWSADVAF